MRHVGSTGETKPTDLCSLASITLRGAPGGQLQSFGNLSNQSLLGEFQICGFFFWHEMTFFEDMTCEFFPIFATGCVAWCISLRQFLTKLLSDLGASIY